MAGSARLHVMVCARVLVGAILLVTAHTPYAAAQGVVTRPAVLTGIVTDTVGRPVPLASLADDGGRVRVVADNSAAFESNEDLERREEGLISLALHGVPGIRLRPKNSDATQWMVEGRGGCEMSIWIDGYMVQKGQANNLLSITGAGGAGRRRGREDRVGIDQLVVGTEVLAIEVYPSGASIPLRFQNIDKAMCGALVIWTKR